MPSQGVRFDAILELADMVRGDLRGFNLPSLEVRICIEVTIPSPSMRLAQDVWKCPKPPHPSRPGSEYDKHCLGTSTPLTPPARSGRCARRRLCGSALRAWWFDSSVVAANNRARRGDGADVAPAAKLAKSRHPRIAGQNTHAYEPTEGAAVCPLLCYVRVPHITAGTCARIESAQWDLVFALLPACGIPLFFRTALPTVGPQ